MICKQSFRLKRNGEPYSKCFCRRCSEARKGKKLSEEHKRKLFEARSKRVICVETGEVFESTRDASRKTGIANGNISNVCNGKHKRAGGYHWKYVEALKCM